MARKPLSESTVAENCLKWGTGGINIDESRVEAYDGTTTARKPSEVKDTQTAFGKGYEMGGNGSSIGRFPANLIHDGSEEVKECFPESKSVQSIKIKYISGNDKSKTVGDSKFMEGDMNEFNTYNDSGSASRFFKSIIYQAKASKSERNNGCEELETKDAGASMNSRCATCGKQKLDHETSRCKCEVHIPAEMKSREGVKNNHPTVKPIALMEYLIKIVTPKGGIVLDPFTGSGSTLVAAKQNGFQYVGIEMTPEYIEIAQARLKSIKEKLL